MLFLSKINYVYALQSQLNSYMYFVLRCHTYLILDQSYPIYQLSRLLKPNQSSYITSWARQSAQLFLVFIVPAAPGAATKGFDAFTLQHVSDKTLLNSWCLDQIFKLFIQLEQSRAKPAIAAIGLVTIPRRNNNVLFTSNKHSNFGFVQLRP